MTVPKKIWLFKSYADEHDYEAVKKVLERGLFWAQGPEIETFENKIKDYVGRKHCLVFNSGTTALYGNLLVLDVNDREVIVPSLTFAATANAVVAAGARPVFADIEETSLGLDAGEVKRKLTKRTKAIVPVHFGGDVCDQIKSLQELAKRKNTALIEDTAHSLGAKLGKECAGTFGDSAMFSFCFNKIISTGEGGAIVTDSPALHEKLKLIRSHGRDEHDQYTDYGLNFRMSSISAALGVSQFEKLGFIISKRRQMAQYINSALSQIKELILPVFTANHHSVYQLYNLRFKDRNVRNEIQKFLKEQNIPTRISYNPLHLTPYYQKIWGYKEGDLPVTEKISRVILTLPFHPGLDKEDLDYIIDKIKQFFR